MITKIAWRNIWRNKLRSIIVIIAIVLGIWAGVVISGVMTGMVQQRISAAIDYEVGHLQIHQKLFLENNDIVDTIPQANEIVKTLKSNPEVVAVSDRLKINGMANTANAGTGVTIQGIMPEIEKTVSKIYTAINDTNGTYFVTHKKYPIVISLKLAEKLEAKLNSKIVLTFQDINGNLTGGAFKVVGIYKTKNSMFDEANLFVKKSDLASLLGINNNQAHEICIICKDANKLQSVKNSISQSSDKLLVQTWEEIQPELAMMNQYMKAMFYVFMVIILLALGFGIINTMLMAILERTRELGMLTAIGMNKQKVFGMIMSETIYLTLIGGVVGMVFSYFTIYYFSINGINLSMFAQGFEGFGIDPIIYPYVTFGDYIVLTILIIITGIISSVYPARKALKKNPVDAIRTV